MCVCDGEFMRLPLLSCVICTAFMCVCDGEFMRLPLLSGVFSAYRAVWVMWPAMCVVPGAYLRLPLLSCAVWILHRAKSVMQHVCGSLFLHQAKVSCSIGLHRAGSISAAQGSFFAQGSMHADSISAAQGSVVGWFVDRVWCCSTPRDSDALGLVWRIWPLVWSL